MAGLIVRKTETGADTDATQKLAKILKICTFKVSPDKRGVKLGKLLLKMVLWYAQKNAYDLAYLTAYPAQEALIALLEFYGFQKTGTKGDAGEMIFERVFSRERFDAEAGQDNYNAGRTNYPRFVSGPNVRGFVIPILERYHDVLFPDLRNARQLDMFLDAGKGSGPKRPGNTIRKVYICKSPSNLGDAGSVLFFYKSKSANPPSQSLTAVGILESVSFATSTKQLMQLTGGRSVYSEAELTAFEASPDNPYKVINYLLVDYIDPPLQLSDIEAAGILSSHPQAITELKGDNLLQALERCNLSFQL